MLQAKLQSESDPGSRRTPDWRRNTRPHARRNLGLVLDAGVHLRIGARRHQCMADTLNEVGVIRRADDRTQTPQEHVCQERGRSVRWGRRGAAGRIRPFACTCVLTPHVPPSVPNSPRPLSAHNANSANLSFSQARQYSHWRDAQRLSNALGGKGEERPSVSPTLPERRRGPEPKGKRPPPFGRRP